MAHQTSYKVKRGGRWVKSDDLPGIIESERSDTLHEKPHINLDFLPSVEDLEKLEEGEVLEYFYICEALVPYYVDGVEVRKKRCGNKFSTEEVEAVCPACFASGESLRNIPRAFLKLFGTNDDVKHYVTHEMKVRGCLAPKYAALAKQIIAKYGGKAKIKVSKVGES